MKNPKRNSKKKSLPFLVFFLFTALFFLSIGLYLSFKKSPFYFLRRVNFVLITKERAVIVFSLQDNQGLVLSLPVKNKVKVTRGFGEYELGKVYPLGELEKKGGLLLKETVQENFSIPIFGYFYDPVLLDYSQLDSEKFFSRIFWQSLRGNIKTDLNWYDLALLYLRTNKLNEVIVRVGNFQRDTADFFKDKALRGESHSIEILNSTEHNGLAQQVSGLLERAGGRVVRTADVAEPQEDCLLFTPINLSKKYTLLWLKLVFDCQIKQSSEKGDRADFTLVVGENYWKKLDEKW